MTMEFKDKNYQDVYIGANVLVDAPNIEDLWLFEFEGQVVELDRKNSYVVVEDGLGDCWTVEVERVEIL